MAIGRCGKISTALLVALLSILLALLLKLSQYEGRPNSPAPPEAIPIWKNSDLTIFNRIIEYAFPLIAPVGTMNKCPVDDARIDQECMEQARSFIREGSAGPWQAMLDAGNHRETVIVIDEGKEESGRPPLEVVLVQPINATVLEMANLPLIVWLHGGGFVAGAARDSYMLGVMQGLAEKGNIPYDKAVWASIEYPLAPEYKYPAAPDACFRALQYLTREHQLVDSSNGTSVRLGGGGLHIGGASAGATLSLLAGQKALQDAIRVDSLLLDTLVLPIQQSQRVKDSSSSTSVFDSPSYRRNFYTRVPPVEWSNWIVEALTGCETKDKSSRCRQDIFGGNALSIEDWEQLADLPPVIVVTDKGCTFRDTALPFIQMYKNIAGEDKIRHVDAKASHSLHLLFDSDASEQIAKLWGGLISSRSCSFGKNSFI